MVRPIAIVALACAICGAITVSPDLEIERRLQSLFAKANADPSTAEDALRTALVVTKQHPHYRVSVQYALASHLMRGPRGAGKSRGEVIALLRAVVAANPDHANARHWLAHQLLRSPRSSDEALTLLRGLDLSRLTDSDPVDSCMLRGQSAERVGQLSLAKEAFEDAVVLHRRRLMAATPIAPNLEYRFGLAYFQLCRVLILLETAAACVALLQHGMAHFPRVFQLHDMLGYALWRTGRPTHAVAVFDAAWQQRVHWPSETRADMHKAFGATLARILVPFLPHETKTDEPLANRNAHGGFPHVTADWPTPAKCNIDRYDRLDRAVFLEKYVLQNKPVLISGLMNEWGAVENWTRSKLLARYGDEMVQVRESASIAFDQEFGGLARTHLALRDFINETMTNASISDRYVFGHALSDALQSDYTPLLSLFDETTFAWPQSKRNAHALWYLGPAGSGVSFHEHSNAWNGLVYGEKRWVLFPPYEHFGPVDLPMSEWFRDWYSVFLDRGTAMYECTQLAGEVLFVPSNYIHGVLNTQPSVGIAVEVGFATTLLESLLGGAQKADDFQTPSRRGHDL